jgi:Na+/melibiose symporter-like transporter
MPSTESISTGNQGQKSSRQRKISLRTKLLFAAGTAQEGMVTAGGIVTIIYYNQVLGLSPSLCGLAFMIAMIFDALSDPLIGAISDNFKSRFGRRHPFMFFSAIPLALGFYLLYQPLAGLSETGLFIWLTGFSMVLRFGQTMYLVPHDALGAELTDDYDERSSIFGYNAVSQMILSMVFTGILYYLIFPTTPEYENGLMNEPRYLLLSVVGAVTIIFSILVCSLGTMDQIPFLHDVDFSSKFIIKDYLSEVAKLLKNPSY